SNALPDHVFHLPDPLLRSLHPGPRWRPDADHELAGIDGGEELGSDEGAIASIRAPWLCGVETSTVSIARASTTLGSTPRDWSRSCPIWCAYPPRRAWARWIEVSASLRDASKTSFTTAGGASRNWGPNPSG